MTLNEMLDDALEEARECMRAGGSLVEAATLIGWGRDELDLALWIAMAREW